MSIICQIIEEIAFIRNYSFCLMGNRFDADDVASEAILRMIMGRYDDKQPFRPYARKVIVNTAIEWRKREQRRRYVDIDTARHICDGKWADTGAILTDIAKIMNDAMNESVCVEALCLYIDGYSYKEIAEMLGVNIGTVKRRIHDARIMLRVKLGDFPIR